MALFGPNWWHHHGIKMKLESFDGDKGIIQIKGSAASVMIARRTNDPGFIIQWKIIQFTDLEWTEGQIAL